MSNPLFSSYRKGEDRITATIMAVFERINLALVENILQNALGGNENPLVSFENQPAARGGRTRPDARLHAKFSYWFETKTSPNSVRVDQLRGHVKHLNKETYGDDERLVVITPDSQQPEEISQLNDPRVTWVSFSALYEAIEEVKSSGSVKPTEREIFLLDELNNTLVSEKLMGVAVDQVLIVPARYAFQAYRRYSAYICQPNRTFRRVERMGFYKDGEIQPLLPKILDSVESVYITEDGVEMLEQEYEEIEKELDPNLKEKLQILIDRLIGDKSGGVGEQSKVVLLSEKDSDDTISLSWPIVNDLTTQDGRPSAWVQNQRYVSLESLRKSKRTSELTTL